MLELELEKATATLENFNPRTEKNGTDRVPAASLKFSMALGADVLAFFAPDLKARLFETSSDLAGELLKVRDTHMVYPAERDEEMYGATLLIEYGVGEPIKLPEALVKDFRLTPMEGGSVIVGFTVNCKPDAWKDVPRLYLAQGQGCTITLEPAELGEMKNAA